MGVYIKGMEMPKSCRKCMISQPDGCGWICPIIESKPIVDGRVNSRHLHCPLVPVPPHGRLIDADALINDMANMIPWAIESPEEIAMVDGLSEGYEAVKAAPTIIPAEEGE